MKQPIDVINVAGLLMDGRNDGIENELRGSDVVRSVRTIAPTPRQAATEDPNRSIDRAIAMVDDAVGDIRRECRDSKIVLVGRSYGAFVALLTAVRMQFQYVMNIVLIEGPLHPDVIVKPPFLIPPLQRCTSHYEARPTLAREAVDYLARRGTAGVTIVQAGAPDSIAPREAHVIPGDFDYSSITDDSIPDVYSNNGSHGHVFRLPSHLVARTDKARKLLPRGYRNHLFWSPEKMALVQRIIRHAAES